MPMVSSMMWMLPLLLVLSSCATVHVRNQHAHLRAPKANPLVANSTKLGVGVLPTFLATMASECKCVFDGVCTCENEMKFMNCVRDACASGKCTCEGMHFLDACSAMDSTCPEGGLQCSSDEASCLNGDVVTRPGSDAEPTPATLPPAIEKTPTQIVPISEVAPASGGSYKAPEIARHHHPYSSAWSPTEFSRMQAVMSFSQVLKLTFIYVVCAILFALLYYKYKVLAQKESFGEKHSSAWFTMKRLVEFKHNDFNTSLFDCFYAPQLCCMSCFCPCLVWSDTADKAKIFPWLSYWPAFALSLFMILIAMWTSFVGSILVAVGGATFRQRMRKQYIIDFGTPKTIAKDVLIWLCCVPCAIVQEHVEEHYQADNLFHH